MNIPHVWKNGRQQGCYYKKMKIYSFRIWKWGFDCYLIKYFAKTQLPIHIDEVKGGKHYRLNIPLKGKATFYWCGANSIYGPNTRWLWTNGIVFFRPDIHKHFLIIWKNSLKLSLGFVKFDKWK